MIKISFQIYIIFWSLSEYQLRFKERTITDYAILKNSIAHDLDAATVCFFAKDTDTRSNKHACTYVYSYAVTGEDNALQICTHPVLKAHVNNIGRYLICTKGMLSVSLVVSYQDGFK